MAGIVIPLNPNPATLSYQMAQVDWPVLKAQLHQSSLGFFVEEVAMLCKSPFGGVIGGVQGYVGSYRD